MINATDAVWNTHQKMNIPLRDAAYITALRQFEKKKKNA